MIVFKVMSLKLSPGQVLSGIDNYYKWYSMLMTQLKVTTSGVAEYIESENGQIADEKIFDAAQLAVIKQKTQAAATTVAMNTVSPEIWEVLCAEGTTGREIFKSLKEQYGRNTVKTLHYLGKKMGERPNGAWPLSRIVDHVMLGKSLYHNEDVYAIGLLISVLPDAVVEKVSNSFSPVILDKVKFETFYQFVKPYITPTIAANSSVAEGFVATRSALKCTFCGKPGHVVKYCWAKAKADKQNRGTSDKNGDKAEDKSSTATPSTSAWYASFNANVTPAQSGVEFCLDSGAGAHMVKDKDLFDEILPYTGSVTGIGGNMTIGGCGTVSLLKFGVPIVLHHVLYVPQIPVNLISIMTAVARGAQFAFKDDGVYIDGIKRGYCRENLAYLSIPAKVVAAVAEVSTSSVDSAIIHHRMGHPALPILHKMCPSEQLSDDVCASCVKGKLTHTFVKKSDTKTEFPLEIIHADVTGPFRYDSLTHDNYFLTIVDNYSRYTTVVPLQNKRDATDALIAFIKKSERLFQKSQFRTIAVRTDNGGEFVNGKFDSFCRDLGIQHQLTVPHNSSQNGIAERYHRTIQEKSRVLMLAGKVPVDLWSEAVNTAVYLLNRTPVRHLGYQTPYFRWFGQLPTYHHLRSFGCCVYAHVPASLRDGKLDATAITSVFMGYDADHRAYRLFDLEKERVFVSAQVKFDETRFPMADIRNVTPSGVFAAGKVAGGVSAVPIHSLDNAKDDSDLGSQEGSECASDAEDQDIATDVEDPMSDTDAVGKASSIAASDDEMEVTAAEHSEVSSDLDVSSSIPDHGDTRMTLYQQDISRDHQVTSSSTPEHGLSLSDVQMTVSSVEVAELQAELYQAKAEIDQLKRQATIQPVTSTKHAEGIRSSQPPSLAIAAKRTHDGTVTQLSANSGEIIPTGTRIGTSRFDTYSTSSAKPDRPRKMIKTLPRLSVQNGQKGLTYTTRYLLEESPSTTQLDSEAPSSGPDADEPADALMKLDSRGIDDGNESGSNNTNTGPKSFFSTINFSQSAFVAALGQLSKSPTTFKKAMKTPDAALWMEACKKEIAAQKANNTFLVTKLPPGKRIIGSRWVFTLKNDGFGNIIHKARVVAQGFKQVEGLDYKETFAPVIRFESVRILLALAAQYRFSVTQMDVTTAFLYGSLEEDLYMSPPEGFAAAGGDTVWHLQKAIYGLKQAPIQWNRTLHAVFEKHGFIRNNSELGIYFKRADYGLLIIGIYVDDLLILGQDQRDVDAIKLLLNNNFNMKDLGSPKKFLGLNIERTKEGINLSATDYIDEMLKDLNMSDCYPAPSPYIAGLNIQKDDESDYCEPSNYRSIIGKLLYCSNTVRLDISYIVGLLSRYLQHPKEIHLKAAIRVLKYLKGTKKYGINYKMYSNPKINGYSDADWAGNLIDRSSTGGYVFHVGNSPISWRSQKQKTTALSSTEAELIALVKAGQEAIHIGKVLHSLENPLSKIITIFEDNQSTITLTEHPSFHDRSKHIDIRYHKIKEWVDDGKVKISYVGTAENAADIFTKALDQIKFSKLRLLAGISDLE